MNPSRLFNPSAPPAAAILAIDLGTSGPKVALMDLAGRLLGMESEPTPVIFLPGGGVEQDPALWWRAIVTATRRLLSRGLIPVERILALGVTAQWSGTVAVDRAGQPLMNAIIWMDDRGAAYAQAMTDGPIKIEGYGAHKMWTWVRMTGGIPGRSGKDPVAHIRLVQDRFPEVYARTHKFLEPKDFLNLKLTGQFAAGTDSIVLHWVTDNRDIHNIHYSDRLLGMAGLEREKLPDLFPATHILGPILP
ncbi:MAG: xylulose kinase, partial [Caldilineaceae bacterium]|nr:xylulose kinase [Caldilineaceae bacterium]